MGRKKSKGPRTKSGQLSRSKASLLARDQPASYIIERRNLFAFATPTKGPDGRNGELDQDICDGIGQLHILGMLDMDGCDSLSLRNAGREFGRLFWNRYQEVAPRTCKYERADRSISAYLGETADDRRFDRMDSALSGYERDVVMSLIVDRAWGDEIAPWAARLIAHGLRERGRAVAGFPTADDWGRLGALMIGLCSLAGGESFIRKAA